MSDCCDCKHQHVNPDYEPCASCYEDDEGSRFELKCPLPRIGSKEWKWVVASDGSSWVSPLVDRYSILVHPGYADAYFVKLSAYGGYCRVAQYLGLVDAKALVEFRVRRDWRKEQRKR